MAIDPDINSVRLAAIRDALDRGGLTPNEVVLRQGSSALEETFSRTDSRAARGCVYRILLITNIIQWHLHSRRTKTNPPNRTPPTKPTTLPTTQRGTPRARKRIQVAIAVASRPRKSTRQRGVIGRGRPRAVVVTAEAAMTAEANAVNLRELPPGRSSCHRLIRQQPVTHPSRGLLPKCP